MIERHKIADREQWLEMRRRNINASEVAIVCGEGAWGSTAELFAEKKGLRPPRIDTGVLKRGRWREASIFEALNEEYPQWDITRAAIYLCDSARRLGCTPDGLATAPDRDGIGIVQAKSVARSIFRRRWLDNPDDSIEFGAATPPAYYVLQVLTEEMLSECEWGVLACLVDSEFDCELRLFDIPRDRTAENRILENVATFWHDYLDPGIMPPFTPQRDEELIKALFPRDLGTTIDLSTDNRVLALIDDLIETQAGAKRLKETEKTIKTELTGKLADNAYGVLGDGRCISWKTIHRRGYTVAPVDYRSLKILKQKPDEDDDND